MTGYRKLLTAWQNWAINIADCDATERLLSRGHEITEADWKCWSSFARFGDWNQ